MVSLSSRKLYDISFIFKIIKAYTSAKISWKSSKLARYGCRLEDYKDYRGRCFNFVNLNLVKTKYHSLLIAFQVVLSLSLFEVPSNCSKYRSKCDSLRTQNHRNRFYS